MDNKSWEERRAAYRLLHQRLLDVVMHLPEDYKPFGQVEYEQGDCSCGCKWFVELEGDAGADWGVCTSPRSHRMGLLTFEHQGCRAFEYGEEDD